MAKKTKRNQRIDMSTHARIAAAARPRDAGRFIDLPSGVCRDRALAMNRRIGPEFTAATDEDQTVITIYDEIGFWGVTASDVRRTLDDVKGDKILVRLNSPGGDAFDGIAIYNDLLAHPADVSVEITGLAASAASIIAMAGDTVKIAETGFIMIHNAWGIVLGNQAEMLDFAEVLGMIDGAIGKTYHQRTGIDIKEIAAMMDAETWLTGEDAVDQGFADQLLADGDDAPKAIFDLSAFNNVPGKIKRGVENALREEGYSDNEAKWASSKGFKHLPGREVPETATDRRDADEAVKALRKLRDELHAKLTPVN